MIKYILDLLMLAEYYNTSESIEIAKGKYALPSNFKQVKKQIKRIKKWHKEK